MKVGVNVIRLGAVDDVEAAVDRLGRIGLDSVWIPDHLLGYYHPEIWKELPGAQEPADGLANNQPSDTDAWLDPFCLAASLGRRTALSLGTCVTDGTRRRAGDLLRTVLTINQSARGGFILGIGAGEAMSLAPFGYGLDRPIGNLEATLAELRHLLDTGAMPDGPGRTGLLLEGPAGLPEIWVAANAPRSLKLTGTYGDGWFHLSTSLELFEQQLSTVRAAAAEAGRGAPLPALVLLSIVGESREHVIEQLDRFPGLKSIMLLTPAALWEAFGLEHPAGPQSRGLVDLVPHELDADMIREVSPTIPVEMLEQFVVLGNAEEIAERVLPFAAAGAQHAVFTDATIAAFPPDEADRLQLEYGRLAQILHAATPTSVAPR